jgi:hypothetical protein
MGCDSSTVTVRESVNSSGCKVIHRMEVVGFKNVKPRFHLPCNVCFEDGKIIPISQQKKVENRLG